jgi:hypothetical protein
VTVEAPAEPTLDERAAALEPLARGDGHSDEWWRLLFEDDGVVGAWYLFGAEFDYDEACAILDGDVAASDAQVQHAEAVKLAAELSGYARARVERAPPAPISAIAITPRRLPVLVWSRARPRERRPGRRRRASSSRAGPGDPDLADLPLRRRGAPA